MAKPVALVTGGAGFIGSHMVDLLLDRGFQVRVIDNLVGGRESNLVQHRHNPDLAVDFRDVRDVSDQDPLYRGVERIFHFAGIGDIVPSVEHPKEYMSVNVQGTICALEGARTGGASRFVYAASSSCYGLADVPTTEDHPICTTYPYALSKFQGEQAALHWQQLYKLPVMSVRIFNAYGIRVRTTGAYGAVFGVFLRQKLAGQPFTVVGDGTQGRDFVYVTDVARAFFLASERGQPGRVYNLGCGKPQTVNRLVELLGGQVTYIPKRPGEPQFTWADNTRITTELGWAPEVSFEEGVGRMVDRIEDWRDAPLWDRDSIAQATRPWFAALSAE